MAVQDYLDSLSLSGQKQAPSLLGKNFGIRQPKLGLAGNAPASPSPAQSTTAQTLGSAITSQKAGAADLASRLKQDTTNQLATDVVDKSAGYVPANQYGIVQNIPQVDRSSQFKSSLESITQTGTLAADAATARSQWQQLKKIQDLQAYNVDPVFGVNYDPKLITPGANNNNVGARAVAAALTAQKNGVPYVWGGDSLTNGVDCSGLVQQVYASLGIKLPRQTYEQAKTGKHVGLNELLPGDLVFYNTGSRDPNGIGVNGHVAIYVGNGQVISANNSRDGIKITSLSYMPISGAVRPW